MKRLLLTFTIIIVGMTCVHAFHLQSRLINMESGLPDNNVRSLCQDDKGYIWLGTPNGLYRYDGYSFITFRYAAEGNMRLLNNNHITAIRAKGNLVFIREAGNHFSVFDTHLNRFIEKHDKDAEDCFATKKTDWLHHRLVAPYVKSVIANGGNVIEDNKGNPVVIDNSGLLWHINKNTGETVKMRVYDEYLYPLISSHKYKVCLTDDGGQIWVSTNGCGITVYDKAEGTTQQIRHSSGLIPTDYILDMLIDNLGNVWVVNEYHGLTCLKVTRSNGQDILLNPDTHEMRSNQIYIIHQTADSTYLIANTKGDAWFAGRDMQIPAHPSVTGQDIHAICNDGNGMLIGTRQQGLRTADGKWYRHNDRDPGSLSSNNIYYIFKDKDKNVWVAGQDSPLDLATPKEDGSLSFQHFFDADFGARVLMQDKRGWLWVGAKKGLYRFLPHELKLNPQRYERMLSEEETDFSPVSTILEDSHYRIWAGTIGSGVFLVENGKHTKLTTANGLCSNEIHALAEDNYGHIWIATSSGITILDPDSREYTHILTHSQPLLDRYSDNCVCKLPDGRLAFGTNMGMRIFTPTKSITSTLKKVPPTITNIMINGVPLQQMGDDAPLSVAPDDAETLTLNHDQNSLTIECTHFNWFSARGTTYSFFLEGYDRKWSEPSPHNFATYKNLPPGKYVLHIKSFDNTSQKDAEHLLTIVIRHPWWATWWAYLIYLTLLAAIGLAVYRQLRTVYQLRRRISIEKELTDYKLQFFTNISHEFRTPLTIIRGAMDRIRAIGEMPAELRQPISNMEHSTNRMLRLINQLLEFRKMQNNKLQLALEETDVVAFVQDIFHHFTDLAQNKRVSYTFVSSSKKFLMPVDRQHLDKIVHNLLSNALKYTPSGGSVAVSVKNGKGELIISVKDTGVGIPKEKQPELFHRFMQSTFSADSIGIGLHLTKALVERHHGQIQFKENSPTGSVFTVSLPTDMSVYQPEDFLRQSKLERKVVAQEIPYHELLPTPMNDRNILVTDDDPDISAFLKQTLQPYFHVETAMDGQTALDMIQQKQPDLVISDVVMPVMDGYELTRRIRSNKATQTIPVILLTALDADDKHLKGIKEGADAYITKPFDMQLLIATCRQLIEQRDKIHHSAANNADTTSRTVAPPEIIVEERDKRLLNAMNTWLYSHVGDPMLSVDDWAEAMGYNRSIFYKKVKALTGQTPADYIRTLRMDRAAQMLEDETVTVAEVCYSVGISDPHYFTKVFKQQFGISPKKYQQGKKAGKPAPQE